MDKQHKQIYNHAQRWARRWLVAGCAVLATQVSNVLCGGSSRCRDDDGLWCPADPTAEAYRSCCYGDAEAGAGMSSVLLGRQYGRRAEQEAQQVRALPLMMKPA